MTVSSRSERREVYVGGEGNEVGKGDQVKNVTRSEGLCIEEEKEKSRHVCGGGGC